MQQPALFMPLRPAEPSWAGMPDPEPLRFNAAELDVGYEVAFPFLASAAEQADN